MFWIFKIFPDWFWWLLLIASLSGYFFSHFIPLKPYQKLIKITSGIGIATTIFIFGMLYCDHAWKQAAQELQHKVTLAEQQSKTVNIQVKEKVIYKTQVIREQAKDIVQFIDREVVKYDNTCVIPLEFISAHNRAAESPK